MKPTTESEVLMMIVGGILGFLGAVLYYMVCAATVEDIISPNNPENSSIPYGISMVMTSLIFTGGFGVCDFVIEDEGKAKNISLGATVFILIAYLLLKVSRVLP